MGFLDNLRDKLRPQDSDYYDDEYYDDEDVAEPRRPEADTSGVLGNTRRPEAESVSVYTRSGRPVGDNAGSSSSAYGSGYRLGYAPNEYARPAAPARDYGYDDGATASMPQQQGGYASRESVLGNTTNGHSPVDIGLKAIPRPSSGQLPPYVLKPVSYDDVQMVVRRVRTSQPVVLVFKNTNIETAKRILDFCFGLACGIGGQVDELGDRVFVVMPQGIELSESDIDKLVADGTLAR